jgi:prepilin signal peptidase PulO-like enzyme (type II secretory pathway)
MNVILAAGGGALPAGALWGIAADAASRRRLTIGTLPLALPLLAAGAAAIAAVAGAHAAAVAACAGVAVAGWIDARTGSIFDPLTGSMMAASLAMCFIEGVACDGVLGAAAVGTALFLLHAVTKGRGLGFGDVKLGTALGMALGVSGGLTAIGLAFIFGGAYGTWLLISKRATAQSTIRFAPFIAAGTVAAIAARLVVQR